VKSVLRYCNVQEDEYNPWYHGERASISTLAGAALTIPGWAALEEFATEKRGGTEKPVRDRPSFDSMAGTETGLL
jgi:hypothetical protein